jgi:undecaprenyl diphosphate synthase
MPADPTPDRNTVPRHVAIVMDGNGRWARQRAMPRAMGHRAGQQAVKRIVETAAQRGVGVLSLFAFSSENWQRPAGEVGMLMSLLLESLDKEVQVLHEQGVELRFIGNLDAFAPELQARMRAATELTRGNRGLKLVVALGYGGRWDLSQAARRLADEVVAGTLPVTGIDEAAVAARLALADLPDVDLFIRTGGEQRISNFLLWQLAYAELYFSDVLWPDYGAAEFDAALGWFAGRERRFGRVVEPA